MERSALVVIVVALAAAGCSGSGRHTTSTQQSLPPVPATHPARGPAPIEVARSSSPLFAIFPGHVATRACRIPRGGPAVGSFRGTCSTRLRFRHRRTLVVFVEHWRGTGIMLARFTHRWRVLVGASGRVLATHTTGAEAPQLWR